MIHLPAPLCLVSKELHPSYSLAGWEAVSQCPSGPLRGLWQRRESSVGSVLSRGGQGDTDLTPLARPKRLCV